MTASYPNSYILGFVNADEAMGLLVRHGATMIPFNDIIRFFPLENSKRATCYRLQVHRLIE